MARTRRIFVASTRRIERKPRDAAARELVVDRRGEMGEIQWRRNVDDVDGAVRMQLAKAQHRALECVEPAAHQPDPPRRARTSRCASLHQCCFTLYQRSAACTRFAASAAAISGSGGSDA